MKFCLSCLQPNRPEANYCRLCGAALPQEEASSVLERYTPLQSGDLLQDRYRVVEQIGESGLSRVFLAVDNLGRRFALKQMRGPDPSDNPKEYEVYLRSFQREADILSSLPHPYLPIARDFIFTPNNFVIVMDYVQGRTLNEVLDESPETFSEQRVLGWALQILEALGYLHSKQPPIIHRNIKPKNIVLESGGKDQVHLIGFGLARYYVEGLERDEDTLGTQGYSPPEQYGAAQTDARTDIFGLGATMFALLSRRSPAEFVECPEPGQLQLNYPDLRSLNPKLSQQTSQAVAKALQADPRQRFQSANEMKSALASILHRAPVTSPLERFHLNQPVSLEETRHCEFKEVKGDDPVKAVIRIISQYVVAFLNSEGGRIYWGIRDEDRVVVGVQLSYRQRDELRRGILDKVMRIQPAISPSAYRINFHSVYDHDRSLRNQYVVEVVVPRSLTNLLYFTDDGEVYVKTEAGKKRLTGTEIQDEIIRRLQR
jgi:serine/threonine protein kinase